MTPRRKIVAAMSGGVDSSVAAALLREAGHEVVGVFLCLGGPRGVAEHGQAGGQRASCCSPQDSADARAVALRLGIPFHVLDFQGPADELLDYFAAEYARGRTPNPCVVCNSRLKFGRLLEYASAVGADAVATGHYARIVGTGGGPRLARARDESKDQSYVLFALPAATLARACLPLGEWTKGDVRAKAASLALPVADKPDSQDFCFAPDGDYAALVERRRPGAVRPGDVLDADGRVIGRHPGCPHYTIGQRRGLGIAAGSPIYVTAIDAAANTVTVGPPQGLLRSELTCSRVVWHGDAPDGAERQAEHRATGDPTDLRGALRALVKIRYRTAAAAATVWPIGADRARVRFDEPVCAVTAGQAAVFYDPAGLVLGGGWID